MVKAFFSRNGQVKITIPKAITEAMQLRHGQEITFVLHGKEWVLRKKDEK